MDRSRGDPVPHTIICAAQARHGMRHGQGRRAPDVEERPERDTDIARVCAPLDDLSDYFNYRAQKFSMS